MRKWIVVASVIWAAQSFGESRIIETSVPVTEAQVLGLLGFASPPVLPPDDAANYRKPILKAAGSDPVGPGQERITIPVDGVAYEVVVTKPHPLGSLIPVDRRGRAGAP